MVTQALARDISLSRMRCADPIPALKRELGVKLAELMSGWNVDNIAYLLGTDHRRVPELRRGKLDRYCLETLIRFLARLRCPVAISVSEEHGARTGGPKAPFESREESNSRCYAFTFTREARRLARARPESRSDRDRSSRQRTDHRQAAPRRRNQHSPAAARNAPLQLCRGLSRSCSRP